MRRMFIAAVVAAPMYGVFGCGGYSSTPDPTGPSGPPPAGTIVIDVIGERGSQSVSPDPATVPAGQTVVWHNIDTTTHRVVLNDGRLDTGNIAPGGFSAPSTIAAPVPYHCTIHPSMVGSVASG